MVSPSQEHTWEDYLLAHIDRDWRPGEFDFEALHFLPDPENPQTRLHVCVKRDCGVRLSRGGVDGPPLCPTCRKVWRRVSANPDLSYSAWLDEPRVRAYVPAGTCTVPGCERAYVESLLCVAHGSQWRRFKKLGGDASAADWVASGLPIAVPHVAQCMVPACSKDRLRKTDVCSSHWKYYRQLQHRRPSITLADYIASHEPEVVGRPGMKYSSLSGIPFSSLPVPLRWEFIYAIQQRDKEGRARFQPVDTRSQYKLLLKSGISTAVGLESLGLRGPNGNVRGMLATWQDRIDALHFQWTGKVHDEQFVPFTSIELRKTTAEPGLRAGVRLDGIRTDWMFDTALAWLRAAPRNPTECYHAATGWTMLDEVIRTRGTTARALGRSDITAFVEAVHERWSSEPTRYRKKSAVKAILEWVRRTDDRPPIWDIVPANFTLEVQSPPKTRSTTANGEAFRFVPQPIVDWMMDHLHLYSRQDAYSTVEFRAMLYLLERTGRRTGEIVRLQDDCVSFDNAGAPYLEWIRGKPPYDWGPRLPIHQETYEVLTEWRAYKKRRYPDSKWLFPSRGHVRADRHYPTSFLSDQTRLFARWIAENHPYGALVEGAAGNLYDFDFGQVDAYSFRHAFAQRMADATDAQGNSTTSPRALQEFMGHANFDTTMAYYEVTAKRLKRALQYFPSRRLNIDGRAVVVDRERDEFTRIAVSHGSCSEPQNVLSGGHGCALNHVCESCPFFLVDPLEKDGIASKREALAVQFERATIINARDHILKHYQSRIEDCDRIIAGIDEYIETLPDEDAERINQAIEKMSDIRRRAAAPRRIDLRYLLRTED